MGKTTCMGTRTLRSQQQGQPCLARPRSTEAVGLGGAWRPGETACRTVALWGRVALAGGVGGGGSSPCETAGWGWNPGPCPPPSPPHSALQAPLGPRPRPQQAAGAPRGGDTANTQYAPVEGMSERMNE